jgi:hypothetical protein
MQHDFLAFIVCRKINKRKEFVMDRNGDRLFEFHFKMDVDMRDELLGLDLCKQVGSFSQVIVKVLKLLSPFLEREHLLRKQRMSRYELVNSDRKIRRKSVHVYLPESRYRQLKAMHHDLNFFSIAQLLRRMLRLFLDLVKLHGNKIIKQLMDLLRLWEEKKERRKHTLKSIRQLLHFIYQKPDISRFINIYDYKYSPVDIYRL